MRKEDIDWEKQVPTEHSAAAGPSSKTTQAMNSTTREIREIQVYHCDGMQVAIATNDYADGEPTEYGKTIDMTLIYGNNGLYIALTPEHARRIAKGLESAADNYERMEKDEWQKEV